MQRSETQASYVQTMSRIAAAFGEQHPDDIFAALHDALAQHGVRRLTIAAITRDQANPVRYHYHTDRSDTHAPWLDQQTLAVALAADGPRLLASVTPVVALHSAAGRPPSQGRLAHAMAAPVRASGRVLGFCVAQGDRQFDEADLMLLDVACVFIGQRLELTREEANVTGKSHAVDLLLHTARALSTELDLDRLFAKFHELVGRVMDASIFFAALLTPEADGLEVKYMSEFGKTSFEKVVLPLTSLSGEVAKTGRAVLSGSPEEELARKAQTVPNTYDSISLMIVPIKLGAHVLGVLSVQSARENAYSNNDADLLVAISEQAALAVENLRNLKASARHAADLKLLVDVASAVSSELDLHRVFSKIHSQVRRVIDAPLFYVALSSDEDDSVRLEYLVEGEHVFQATTYAASGTIVGTVINSGAPVLVRNAEERDRLTTRRIGAGPTTVQSVAAVPMRVGGRVIGALSVQSYEPNAYNDRHLEVLQAIAEQSAVAVQNARLYEQAKVLADNDALTGLPHHRTIQERLSMELKRSQRANGKLAFLMMDIDNFKVFNDSYGHPAGDRAIKHVASLLRQVARETDIVGRYGGDEFCAILPDGDRAAAEGFSSRLAAELARRPVLVGGRQEIPLVLSVGCAVFPDNGHRRDEIVGAADAELYERKRGDEPKPGPKLEPISLLLGNLNPYASLISALTNSSRFMREHVYRMNSLAAVYAEFAGMPENSIERDVLLRSATLVDIGMLAIPAGILNKPGKLEHKEFDVVKTHARLGHDMLALMDGGEAVATAVLHHHERFDGSGYPNSLRAEGIPKTSRILAVLDAYTAMTSDRPFRRAMSGERAVRELRLYAGSQFDPAVVELLLSALRK